MARIEELVRRIRIEMQGQPEEAIRAKISELHRKDAQIAIGKVSVVPTLTGDWKADLLQTRSGKQAIQAKLESDTRVKANFDRYTQLRNLVWDIFVEAPETTQPVNGWVPRVRKDVYYKTKDKCWELRTGGTQYDRVTVALKYAMSGSRDYRDALQALGL